MKHSFHSKRAVFRHNLEIIRTLVECWKDCLHVPYRQYLNTLTGQLMFIIHKAMGMVTNSQDTDSSHHATLRLKTQQKRNVPWKQALVEIGGMEISICLQIFTAADLTLIHLFSLWDYHLVEIQLKKPSNQFYIFKIFYKL